jgi:hypothetical protein
MATEGVALESIAHEDRSRVRGDVVVWGKPARRFTILFEDVVSFFDLFRVARDEDAAPLSLAFVKLAMLVLVGVAVTSAIGYAVGALVARGYASFAG